MIQFRTALSTFLKTLHPRVYFQVAPENAVFPYLVYDFTNVLDDGEISQIVTVDIDGWDMEEDTTALETMMQTANAGLNKKVISNDSLAATFYLESKLSPQDTDKRIIRRKYIYTARLFMKG